MNFQALTNFEKMITPTIIKILYYIAIAAAVIAGIVVFFGGIIDGVSGGGIVKINVVQISFPLIIVLGVLFARVYAELMILAFNIHSHLVAIRDMMANR